MAKTSHKSVSFHPEKDIPSLAGRVILITGASDGLGKQAVFEYARHNPAHIWLAVRNLSKAETVVADVRRRLSSSFTGAISVVHCDLSSLESVREAALTVLGASERLDILMLNAGVMAVDPGLTDDGYETHFGTNFLGHALLLALLIPLLQTTTLLPDADPRVVMVSSDLHTMAPADEGIRFDSLRRPATDDATPYLLYGQSELAIILLARRMARVYPRFKTVAVHPGAVHTELLTKGTGGAKTVGSTLSRMFRHGSGGTSTQSVEQGVRNQLWASVADGVRSGEYYVPVGVLDAGSEWTQDDFLAMELWHWTHGELEPFMQT